jgi:ABC-type multidrug transport system fused ATPase/permease subunit
MIIMVAHRLKTLLDFDKVAIIGNSQVAAFGEPVVLLSDKVSAEVKLRLHE